MKRLQEFIVDKMGKTGEFDSFNMRVQNGAGQHPEAPGKGPLVPRARSIGKQSMRSGRGVGAKRRHEDACKGRH